VSFAAINICGASQRVFIVVSYISLSTQSGSFWMHPRNSHSASQDVSRHLLNEKVYYRVHMSPPLCDTIIAVNIIYTSIMYVHVYSPRLNVLILLFDP